MSGRGHGRGKLWLKDDLDRIIAATTVVKLQRSPGRDRSDRTFEWRKQAPQLNTAAQP
jgi:hypothetical protein